MINKLQNEEPYGIKTILYEDKEYLQSFYGFYTKKTFWLSHIAKHIQRNIVSCILYIENYFLKILKLITLFILF